MGLEASVIKEGKWSILGLRMMYEHGLAYENILKEFEFSPTYFEINKV